MSRVSAATTHWFVRGAGLRLYRCNEFLHPFPSKYSFGVDTWRIQTVAGAERRQTPTGKSVRRKQATAPALLYSIPATLAKFWCSAGVAVLAPALQGTVIAYAGVAFFG